MSQSDGTIYSDGTISIWKDPDTDQFVFSNGWASIVVDSRKSDTIQVSSPGGKIELSFDEAKMTPSITVSDKE